MSESVLGRRTAPAAPPEQLDATPGPGTLETVTRQVAAGDPESLYRQARLFARVVNDLQSAVDGVRQQARRLEVAVRGASAQAAALALERLAIRLDQMLAVLRDPDYAELTRRAGDALAESQRRLRLVGAQRSELPADSARQDYQAWLILRELSAAYRMIGARMAALPPQPGVFAGGLSPAAPEDRQVADVPSGSAAPRAGMVEMAPMALVALAPPDQAGLAPAGFRQGERWQGDLLTSPGGVAAAPAALALGRRAPGLAGGGDPAPGGIGPGQSLLAGRRGPSGAQGAGVMSALATPPIVEGAGVVGRPPAAGRAGEVVELAEAAAPGLPWSAPGGPAQAGVTALGAPVLGSPVVGGPSASPAGGRRVTSRGRTRPVRRPAALTSPGPAAPPPPAPVPTDAPINVPAVAGPPPAPAALSAPSLGPSTAVSPPGPSISPGQPPLSAPPPTLHLAGGPAGPIPSTPPTSTFPGAATPVALAPDAGLAVVPTPDAPAAAPPDHLAPVTPTPGSAPSGPLGAPATPDASAGVGRPMPMYGGFGPGMAAGLDEGPRQPHVTLAADPHCWGLPHAPPAVLGRTPGFSDVASPQAAPADAARPDGQSTDNGEADD